MQRRQKLLLSESFSNESFCQKALSESLNLEVGSSRRDNIFKEFRKSSNISSWDSQHIFLK